MLHSLSRIGAQHRLGLMNKTTIVGRDDKDLTTRTPIIVCILKDETAMVGGGGNPSNSNPAETIYYSDF